jgi:tetratricopeptide (TPR) repeat protein
MKKAYLMLFVLVSINCVAQQKNDSFLLNRINRIEQNIENLNSVSNKIDKVSDKIDTKYNNIITDKGNYIGWASFLLAAIAIFFGGVTIKSYLDTRRAKRESDTIMAGLKAKMESINEIVQKVQVAEEKLSNSKSEFDKSKTDFNETIISLKEKFEEQLRTAKEQRELDIKYVEACENLEEGSIDKAKAIFNSILSKNKDYHKASCKMAMCYSAEGENERAKEAINDFIKKIEVLKEHNVLVNGDGEVPLEAFSTKGIILRRLKNFDDAIKAFRGIEQTEGKMPKSLYTHIGYSYMYKGDADSYDKAIMYFQKGGRIDKSSPSFYGLVKADTLKNQKVNLSLLKEALILSNKDTLENTLYPYHNFGAAFLLMLQNQDGNNCLKQLKYSLEICRNLGTLKEQLFEYELFKSNGLTFLYLDDSIDELKKRIIEIELKLNSAKKLLESKFPESNA